MRWKHRHQQVHNSQHQQKPTKQHHLAAQGEEVALPPREKQANRSIRRAA